MPTPRERATAAINAAHKAFIASFPASPELTCLLALHRLGALDREGLARLDVLLEQRGRMIERHYQGVTKVVA